MLIQNSEFRIQNFKQGFTFFEVLISIGILVILSTIVLQSFLVARNRENTRQAGLQLIAQARQAQTLSLTGQIGSTGTDQYIVGLALVKDARVSENKKFQLDAIQLQNGFYQLIMPGASFSPAQLNDYGDLTITKIEIETNDWAEVNGVIIGFHPPRGLVKFYNSVTALEVQSVKNVRVTLLNYNNNQTRVLIINTLGQMTLQQ